MGRTRRTTGLGRTRTTVRAFGVALVIAMLAVLVIGSSPGIADRATADSSRRTPTAKPARSRTNDARATTVSPTVSHDAFVDTLTADVGGRTRRWTLVAPASTNPSVDLVLVLHGVGGSGTDMRHFGFDDLARTSGVAVAYPDAADGMWNDGRPGVDPPASGAGWADDIAFFRALVASSGTRMGRTVRSVGVVGFSNGAMMAARAGCDMADLVSVVAAVDGSAGENFESRCRPALPVSVALVATRGDPVVPFVGGQVAAWQGRARGRVAGVDATMRFWLANNRCAPIRDLGLAATAPLVARLQADGCDDARQVVRLAIDAAQHEWVRTAGFDTTAAVWSFVHQQLPRPLNFDIVATQFG